MAAKSAIEWTDADLEAFAYRAYQGFWPDRDESEIRRQWESMPALERQGFYTGVNGAVTLLVVDGLVEIGLPWLPLPARISGRREERQNDDSHEYRLHG